MELGKSRYITVHHIHYSAPQHLMRSLLINFVFLFFCFGIALNAFGQYTWKLTREKDGIRVYQSKLKNSDYKSLKVECTFEGTYDKLLAVLNDVGNHQNWVYNNKNASLIKRISSNEFYYYSETSLPWPMANRDAIVHLKVLKDTLGRFLKITAIGEPKYLPEKSGKVRVPYCNVQWFVTMPTTKTIHIVYTFEADPGGNVPSWIVNSFADKGPFESFKKLEQILKN